MAGQILIASGRVNTVAKALICGSILNLIGSFILIRPFGLAGVATSTVIASVVVDFIAIPLLLQKALGFKIKDFFLSACVRPVAVGVLQISIILLIRIIGRPEGWIELCLQGVLAGVSFAIILLFLGITMKERKRFFWDPIRRFWGHKIKTAVE